MNEFTPWIRQYFLSEYGKNGVLVPSARFGLYCVAKSVFFPGDKVIVSPITCSTVIIALLAAGVVPVFVDVHEDTGNIDITRLSKKRMESAKGIITTNLYGTPDNATAIRKLCNGSDVILIEDCAHLVRASIHGARVGSIGDVAVFSFGKFLGKSGGAVLTNDTRILNRVRELVLKEARFPTWTIERGASLKGILRKCPGWPLLRSAIRWNRNGRTGEGHRRGDSPEAGFRGYKEARRLEIPSLKPFDPLLAEGGKAYDAMPTQAAINDIERALRAIERNVRIKQHQNESFIRRCKCAVKKANYEAVYTNLVVPVFTEKRTEIVNRLKSEKNVEVWFLYDPPLNRIFSKQAVDDAQSRPEIAEIWSKSVLPVNTAYGDAYLEIMDRVL